MRSRTDEIDAVAALQLPMRRRIYEFVAANPDGVNRDETAAAVDVARSVAAFNLDKLAEVGLVDVEYRRPEGRSGPGAGRPAKWYRRAEGDVSVNLPGRSYDLAAEILVEAVERSRVMGASQPDVRGVAREYGQRIGAAAEGGADDSAGPVLDVLADHGYEPEVRGDVVVMTNCPFHALVDRHRALVCTMNQALLAGVADDLGLDADAAQLDPAPDRCCVTLALGGRRSTSE